MKRFIILSVIISVCAGCVTMPQEPLPAEGPETIIPATARKGAPEEEILPELQNVKEEVLEEYTQKKGVIFAKTEFGGLLETRYVKFLFEDQEDPTHKFQLHIGESSVQQGFPWDVKTVEPGYFFVELPAGKYKISSVTIPVGSTTATEKMDVDVEVIPDAICYVGTLKMVGTKERIKLGGVPVIKPGFEYTVEIVDAREEGAAAFKKNYPDYPHGVSIKLMSVNPVAGSADKDSVQP